MLVLVPVLLIPVQPLKKLIKRLTHLSEFVFFYLTTGDYVVL